MTLLSSPYFWLSLFLLACISLFIRRPFTLLIARPFYPPALRSHSSYLRIHYVISTFWVLFYGANALLAYYGIKGLWPYLFLALGLGFSFITPDAFIWFWLKTGRGSRVPRRWLKTKPSRQAVGCAVTPQYLEKLEQAKAELSRSFKDKCDVAVVGGGIGGLTAAALLAQKGYDVQVFEQHSLPGGYCTAFKRQGYTFDAAVHYITGIEGTTGKIWEEAGMQGVEWIKHPLFARIIAPDKIWDVPQGLAAQEEYFSQHFPWEREGIKKFYGVLGAMHEFQKELPSLPETVKEAKRTPREHPVAFKYLGAQWQDLMDEYLNDPRLKALLSYPAPWVGVPPHLAAATNITAIWSKGTFYPRGGTQKIPDALMEAIRAKGGAVHLRQGVSRLVLDNGRVVGIELDNGARVSSKAVLYAADFRQLAYQMLGRELLYPKFLKYLETLTYSLSAFVVYLGVNKPLPAENLTASQAILGNYDPETWYHRILEGKMALEEGTAVFIPTLLDAAMAPEQRHVVILETVAPYKYQQPWKEAKAEITMAIIGRAEKIIPGLSRSIEVEDAASPLTMERYTKNYAGAIYGLAQIPEQMGNQRPFHKTPIPGLYLAGHNTFPGAGVQGAAISAWLAVKKIGEEI